MTNVDLISLGLLSLFGLASVLPALIWRRMSTVLLAGGLCALSATGWVSAWLSYSKVAITAIDNVLTFLTFVTGVTAAIGIAWSWAEAHQAITNREPNSMSNGRAAGAEPDRKSAPARRSQRR